MVQDVLPSVVGLYIEGQPSLSDEPRGSLGAGVIVNSNGLFVTNAHVVKGARSIVVQTNGGSKFFGKMIGIDEQTDLALVKIQSNQTFQPIKIGQSSELRIGTEVIAVGNPFGLQQTVTSGIVSSLHRSDLSSRIQDYIQIDASINPGNSGGALVNENGELIGINTSILSTERTPGKSPHNIGIGFALPIDIVIPVIHQLQKYGHVKPGWLGASTQDLDESMASALQSSTTKGVVVTETMPNSPASTAGLEPLDIVTHINNVEIADREHFRSIIVVHGPDKQINLRIISHGEKKSIKVTTGSVNDYNKKASSVDKSVFDGIHVVNHNELNLKGTTTMGLRVIYIDADSPGTLSGLIPNDIILSINGKKINQISEFPKISDNLKAHNILHVLRGEQSFYVALGNTKSHKNAVSNVPKKPTK